MFVIALVARHPRADLRRLVQLAVSRQREYLADASSVELTRNPYGLERALAKIAADKEPLEVANRGTQHLYIVNPIKKLEERSSGLMSTHPPILDRINRLRALTGEAPLDDRLGGLRPRLGAQRPGGPALGLGRGARGILRRRRTAAAGGSGRDSSVGRARD